MKMADHPSPTTSVILPTYNRAVLLPPVIRSILDQDFADLELVIFDDGSTDNTGDVVREMQARDARLRYVALPENRGLGHARDAGLRYAAGRYIALADSDDLWLPGRLRAQIEVLEKYPGIDILFGDFLNIDHVRGTQKLGLVGSRKGLELVVTRQIEDGLFLVEGGLEIGILRSNFIAAPTMMLRREVFDRVGGFNINLSTPVDLEFCWRAAALGAQYAYIDRPLIERHRHADSMTAQGDRPWLQRLPAMQLMYQTCREAGRHDLLKYVRATEMRTYRNLLRIYGETGQRIQAVRAYMRSLKCGVSARTSALLAISLLGPRAIVFIQKIRGIRQK
jgi:glycosyltransferase involved in cell wall biosynthesis